MHKRSAILLLNLAHAVDHMFLLIFATAVATIAADFGFARWEDLMPFGVGAFVMFGLGSLPSGRLGDLWGRRAMMVVFFFGIGASSLLASLAQGPWQLAAALTLIGSFASIYHPVGIPMLLQGASRPGATIGINGLAGNLGIAVAAGEAQRRRQGASASRASGAGTGGDDDRLGHWGHPLQSHDQWQCADVE
jgi:MFS family permease